MIRRLAHALAALGVAALLVVAPGGTPALAAPSGLCTVQEWQDPHNFIDCTKRLRDATAQRAQCIQAPSPASPDAGVAGWVTSRPDASMRPGVVGKYTLYGVGGYRMQMYDVTCTGGIAHPEASMESSVASLEFGAAAAVLGGANALRETAYQPGSMWSWSDGFVADTTNALYGHVFATLGALTLALTGIWLLARAHQGRWSETLRVTGWAVFVLVLTTAVARYPLQAAHGADQAAAKGLAVMHGVLGPAPADLPADRCVPPMTPDGCRDHRTVATRASDEAVETVLYRGWLRATLGSADSTTAKKYGAALYDASAFTWADAATIDSDPSVRSVLVARKADQWNTIAEQIKAEDPEAYENLQGLHGEDRVGTGFVTLLSTIVYSIFDVAASLVILFGFGIFRLVIMMLPLVATVGMFQPAAGMVRWSINAFAAALLNIVVFGAGAGAYLMVAGAVFGSSLSGLLQVSVVAVAGAALWMLLRPIRKIGQIFGRRPDEPTTEDGGSWRSRLWAASGVAFDVAAQAAANRATSNGPVHAEGWAGKPRPEALALAAGKAGAK